MNVRVGVFVCNCGTNIGGVVNVADVVEYASHLDGVVIAEEGKWICSVDYLSKIKEIIAEHKLNRVVVACCTPRTHKSNPKLATEKAKDLVKMGVAKAILLEPGPFFSSLVKIFGFRLERIV